MGIDAEQPLIIDLDATLVTAHSTNEYAAPTFKRGFGFHPLLAFVDHGQTGTGEPLTMLLRTGNAAATPPTITSPWCEMRWRSYRSPPAAGSGAEY
jgi:hypothetical protein